MGISLINHPAIGGFPFVETLKYSSILTTTAPSTLPRLASEVLASKRDEVSSAKRRYDDGLEKVISTEEQVETSRICLNKSGNS